MCTSIGGIYRNGRVELTERPQHVQDETHVIVTFLNENEVDLRAYGIDAEQATELHARLAPFAKTRSALVVQANQLQTGVSQVIVAMITSQMFRAGHPSRVTILLSTAQGRQSGLLADSVVISVNLATITDSSVNRVVGSLPMMEVEAALRHTLDCSLSVD